eukprot:TRINITY_DN7750_c0_g2_i1.p1 TRINITY_DN7750_c0_g2~~TRINITY_DN7750_c0_g2_i1.p1  ORF type:complete len:643 (-),score=166.26 TRINITY_DN7750_c0_g2_i1:103-1827(-)
MTMQQNTKGTQDKMTNLFHKGYKFDLAVFLSDRKHGSEKGVQPVWVEQDLEYSWAETNNRTFEFEVPMTDALKNNGTLYAHAFFYKSGTVDPSDCLNKKYALFKHTHPIVEYRAERKNSTGVNLLSDNPQALIGDSNSEEKRILAYAKPTFDLRLVYDFSTFNLKKMNPQYKDFLKFNRNFHYEPFVYVNDFWVLEENMIELNDTLDSFTLTMSYNSIQKWKFDWQVQFGMAFEMHEQWGTMPDNAMDDFKRILIDNNIYFLALTFIISTLHSVFDFLAFKNDITFWKKRKSSAGLSVRSILINCFFQLVILLYLFDNDTSWMILGSSAVGLVIEIWKIKKVFKVEFKRDDDGQMKITMDDSCTALETETKKYDKIATKHLFYVLIPLMIGYSIYSLVFMTHKSYYSWILGSLVGFVYAFGFIMMTPQLYINYKLKSVAHMPWRAMIYKSLNTFVDDLFAFVIRMPIMHRISCFRDDIIFFIYLYQRWKYPVDKTRINEFGTSAEDEEEYKRLKAGGKLPEKEGLTSMMKKQIASVTAAPASTTSTTPDNSIADSKKGTEPVVAKRSKFERRRK